MPRERGLTSPSGPLEDRPASMGPLPHNPERQNQTQMGSPLPPLTELPSSSVSTTQRASTSNLRSAFRQTIRAVTPEPAEASPGSHVPEGFTSAGVSQMLHDLSSASPQTSPRTIPSAPVNMPAKRQGVVFQDDFAGSFDSTSSSPPARPQSFRPRTHTMDGSFRQQLAPATELRNRLGSFSSATSLPVTDDMRMASLQSPVESYKSMDFIPPGSSGPSKDKKGGARSRLSKRPSSRPSSPLSSLPPSVDSLPLPIPTTDANKILLLMKNLCGRMRGEIEYQKELGSPWVGGMCYIEEEKGSLMFDPGDIGPFHTALISDLRGCRVVPVEQSEATGQCLEICSPHLGVAILLRPLVPEEFDLWLAALLCWQQLRPANSKSQSKASKDSPAPPGHTEMKRRVSSNGLREKESAIIKVGKVMLWDRGAALSPRAIVRRPSTRDLRSLSTCWRRVSCILHDNGELKIMTENDMTVLSVIELSQLARSAIQQLDRSVLDEDYCLAIFPIYSFTSTQLSIFRPVYIALESRTLFEVWYVLLRAFTIPDIYTFDPTRGEPLTEVVNLAAEPPGETFRVEKTITLRVTEAKIRSRTWMGEGTPPERWSKSNNDDAGLVGNYLAEVILDGEVRARTPTRAGTKHPFWREDYEFTDLPVALPFVSVLLKRVNDNTESFARQIQATLGLAKPSHPTEILCGCVDIPLHEIECGKDYEQWLPIYDDKQGSVGQMLVKVRHEELVVFLGRHYNDLSELLHKFDSGLAAQIAEALPGNLRRVAEIFVNIFQVTGRADEWLMNMVEEEIDGIGNQTALRKGRFSTRLKSNDSVESTVEREMLVRELGKSLQGEANLLFRGNSLLTQALEFHMRRLGREYLTETLGEKIVEINESDCDCEVDPSKVAHSDDLHKNWNNLIQFTTEIWEAISVSATRLPPELRQILKYIRAVAEDRYGDFLRTVTYTSVSGFLFLRFLCPAILNPKLFGLLRDHPRPRAQRTLTLIAKSLQALANLSTIGKKETWMEPMNRFLTAQRQAFKDFLDTVCAIPADRRKSAVPPSYSTPNTIMGRLAPLAREGFPSLPYLIDQPRNFAALVKLWADNHPPSASSSQVYEGDLLKFHNICIELHQRATACLARIDALRNAEGASQPADDVSGLADVMDRITVGDMFNLSAYGGSNSGLPDTEGPPPKSSGSDVDPTTASTSSSRPFGAISIGSPRDLKQLYRSESNSTNRESTSLRQVSRSSEVFPQPTGSGNSSNSSGSASSTVRSLRSGIHPRKLLSGFIRKARSNTSDGNGSGPSPEASPTLINTSVTPVEAATSTPTTITTPATSANATIISSPQAGSAAVSAMKPFSLPIIPKEHDRE